MRLIDFIAKRSGQGKRYAKRALEGGEVLHNHSVVNDGRILVGKFDHIAVAGQVMQAKIARYLMLHKPSGILSATSDPLHSTVIDLIHEPWAEELHLAGRLDRSTTGLVILTNDSEFSESLSQPGNKIPKTYLVETDQFIAPNVIEAFRGGMYFAKEDIHTQPAEVALLSRNSCRLTIFEGKHHQIKRMFLRYGIRVTKLHRESIGSYSLPDDLMVGAWKVIERT
jgi:16S rRNA pseudouridine516 synthase